MQNVGKDVAECSLGLGGRFLIGRGDRQLRLRQRLDVGLAIWRHRHLVELLIGCGHHVLSQALSYFIFHSIRREWSVGGIVSTQVLLAGNLANHDNHLVDAINLEHHILNLAQLNAQATQLDLMIGAT